VAAEVRGRLAAAWEAEGREKGRVTDAEKEEEDLSEPAASTTRFLRI